MGDPLGSDLAVCSTSAENFGSYYAVRHSNNIERIEYSTVLVQFMVHLCSFTVCATNIFTPAF